MRFVLQKTNITTTENMAVQAYCCLNNIDNIYVKENSNYVYQNGDILVGSVEFVERYLNRNYKPDYFPVFLKNYIGRKIWETDQIPTEKCFIKPLNNYKTFTGFIFDPINSYDITPPFLCSEIVSFKNEWRYYVANGEVICAYWYTGENEDKPAPSIAIDYPKDFSGAVDFGELDNGIIELVESHHPYAIGFYGGLKNYKLYSEWLIKSWDNNSNFINQM